MKHYDLLFKSMHHSVCPYVRRSVTPSIGRRFFNLLAFTDNFELRTHNSICPSIFPSVGPWSSTRKFFLLQLWLSACVSMGGGEYGWGFYAFAQPSTTILLPDTCYLIPVTPCHLIHQMLKQLLNLNGHIWPHANSSLLLELKKPSFWLKMT